MSGTPRTVLVTGATEGIGHEIARRLTAHRAKVIVHARTAREGEDAFDRLIHSGADPRHLDMVTADFARLEEVRELADHVAAKHPRVDVLINNAALAGPLNRIITQDGNELTFQVNYLAPYLLTRLLWRQLTVSGNSRVVNVSSTLHRSGVLHWADLTLSRRYTPGVAYAQSKLAITLFTKGLAEYGQSGPDAVAVHPGVVATPMLARYGRTGGPVTEAAAAVVHLASPGVPVINGGYYNRLSPADPAPLVRDRKTVWRLWRLSTHLTRLDGVDRRLHKSA